MPEFAAWTRCTYKGQVGPWLFLVAGPLAISLLDVAVIHCTNREQTDKRRRMECVVLPVGEEPFQPGGIPDGFVFTDGWWY